MSDSTWVVRLTAAAEVDFQDILNWTAQRFGADQARSYTEVLNDALTALTEGPATAGVRRREDIGKDLYSLHVARNRRRGRHLILFRIGRGTGQPAIEVLRLLHDTMDIARHLPRLPGEEET